MLKYHPKHDRMWDAWIVSHTNQFHLFHLQTRISDGEADPRGWGHAVSTDLLRWQELSPVMPPTGTEGDRLYRYTGCTVAENDRFFTFSTRRNGRGDQSIGLSLSDDLFNWTDCMDSVLTPDPALFLASPLPGWSNIDCRDMTIYPLEHGYCGYFAAVEAEKTHSGVIGAALSDDLVHWHSQKIVYRAPPGSIVEMPEVFPFDGRFVLIFLTGQSYGRIEPDEPFFCRMTGMAFADTPLGPFTEDRSAEYLLTGPPESGYSCRTVMVNGKRRVLYVDPCCGDARLSLPKTLDVGKNGRPRLFFAEDLCSALRQASVSSDSLFLPPSSFAWNTRSGTFEKTNKLLYGRSTEKGRQLALIKHTAPYWELCADIVGHAAGCGFSFYEAEKNGKPTDPYKARSIGVSIEPNKRQIAVKSLSDGQLYTARRFTDNPRGQLRALLTDNTLEVYWNNELLLNVGLSLPEMCFPGFFVESGEAVFDNFSAYPLALPD